MIGAHMTLGVMSEVGASLKMCFFGCMLSLTEYFSIALCEWPFLLTSDKAWDVSSPLGSSMQSVSYQEMTLMQPEGSCVSSDHFQKRCCSSLRITFWNIAVVKKNCIFQTVITCFTMPDAILAPNLNFYICN